MADKLVERVKVAVRLRPLIEDELISKDKSICVENVDTLKKTIIIKKDFEKRQFQFDNIFDPKTNQQIVYNEIARNVVDSVIKGFNGTIFCYGQTGTGKTYTMMGQPETEQRGIIPRTFEQIFNDIQSDQSNQYVVQLGYLQIYMEMLLDLIRPDNQDIKIRECPDSGVFVSGLEWVDVDNVGDCMAIINFAEKNKVVAFTSLNAHSSRSHSMLLVKIERKSLQTQSHNHSRSMTITKKPSVKQNNFSQEMLLSSIEDFSNSSIGNLYLVDLAGSERIKKSRATGDRLSEARSINYSLTALGKCIHALTGPKSTFVPFRDSKLTRILQDSLGGNCKTALIINIGPAGKHADETLSSLTFGMRAMKVQNTPCLNLNKDYEVISHQLQMELESKDEQISKLEKQQNKLVSQVQQLTKELQDVKTNTSMVESYDGNIYKQKLEKAEEEHKAFLEEIDNMMVEQEQENEELKNQICQLQSQLQKEQETNKQLVEELVSQQQQNKELEATIEDLHEVINTKDKAILRERSNSNFNQKENVNNFDIIKHQKERQNQQWRMELQDLTNQYAHLLEDKKRLELVVNQLNNQIEQQQNQLQTQSYSQQQLQSQQKVLQSKIEYQSTQSKEQNFEVELRKSLQVSNMYDGQILMELQDKMHKYETQLEQICEESQQKDDIIKDLITKLQAAQQDAENQKQQLQVFSKKSQLSLQKMEDTMISEVVKGVLDKIIIQIEINSLDLMQDDVSSKAYDSDFKLNTRSFAKSENTQLVESLFINSRRSQQQAIIECDEEDYESNNNVEHMESQFNESQKMSNPKLSQQSLTSLQNQQRSSAHHNQEIFKLPNFSVSKLNLSKSRQDSVFSFSDKHQQRRDVISLYEDELSDIHQQSVQDSQVNDDEISIQVNFNDPNAVEKLLTQIKKKSNSNHNNNHNKSDLSLGSIQQAQSPIDYEELSERKQRSRSTSSIRKNKQQDDLQEVIKAMANMLVEKNQMELNSTKSTLRGAMIDFNNLCNTLTTYFL